MKYEHLVLWETLHTETVNCKAEQAYLADEVFIMLQNAYHTVKGGLDFSSADELLSNTTVWKVIYYEETIVGVVIYKAKKGLKMVALAVSDTLSKSLNRHTKTMLSYIFKMTFNNTWMEVSEAAERFIVANGGERYYLSNTLAQKLTGKKIISLCDDGYHYKRIIKGILKTKVMVGNPKF